MELYTPYKEELDQEAELAYAKLAQEGNGEAILRLVGSVGKWVRHVIHSMPRPSSISDQDIYDEISSDLFLAVKKFDPDRARFVTYITPVIRGKSRDAINRLSSSILRPRSRLPKNESSPDVIPIGSIDLSEVVECEDEIFYHLHVDELASVVSEIVGQTDNFRQHWKKILDLRMSGRSIIECAQTLGVPRKYVENAISAMRQHVSSELAKRETDSSVWVAKACLPKERETMWD